MDDIRNEPNPGTDKFDLGYITDVYADILNPLKYSAKRVFEIGIYKAHSLELWRNFFVNAEVVGVDINPPRRDFDRTRIQTLRANAYTPQFVSTLASPIDVIIDDGPHTYESMVSFLTLYPALLSKDGVLVLEDIIDISWTPRLLQLIDTDKFTANVIHMAGRQKTPHLLGLWRNGLDVIVVQRKKIRD